MNDSRAKKFLNSIGWCYQDTESAARIIADKAQKKIDQLEGMKKQCEECKALVRKAIYDCPGHADGSYPCSGYELRRK